MHIFHLSGFVSSFVLLFLTIEVFFSLSNTRHTHTQHPERGIEMNGKLSARANVEFHVVFMYFGTPCGMSIYVYEEVDLMDWKEHQ